MASPGVVTASAGALPSSLVGAAVRKRFGRAFFAGTVTSHDAATGWFKVKYEDDDEEELDAAELAQLLQPASRAADVQRQLAGGAPDDDDQDEEDAEDEDEPEAAPPPIRGGGKGGAGRAIRKRRGSSDENEAAKPRGGRAKRSRPPPRRRGRAALSDGGSSDASGGSDSGSDEDRSESGSREPWEDDGVTEDEAASSSEEEEEPPPPPPRAAPKAPKAPKAAKTQPPLRKGAVAAAPAGAETDVSEEDAAVAPSREAGKAAAAAIKAKAKAKAKEAAKHRVAGPVLVPGPAADAAVKASRAEFQRLLLLAVRSEDERFNACGGVGPDGKRLSRRADLVAFTELLNANAGVNQRPVVGHVPGIAIGVRFYGRAEVAAVGLHRHWLCGISYISKKESPYGAEVATSIVVSGGYEDDEDNGTDLVYTGQGGNDLLGRKKQLADQKWDRGNIAMRNAQQKGVPVRVIRANPDKQAPYGRVFIYDGLYDVTASEEKFGVSGYKVIQFRLKRQAAQPALTSATVAFGHASLPSDYQALRRPGLLDDDISRGQERIPVVAVNEVDDALPLCTRPATALALRERARALGLAMLPAPKHTDDSLRAADAAWAPALRYTAVQEYAANAPKPPAPATGCDCGPAGCAESSHCACAALNDGGELAYVDEGKGRPVRLMSARAVVRECGPACGCPPSCANRVTQRGLRHRLELFRTADGRGWGVRSWDTIAAGEYVCSFLGTVVRDEDVEAAAAHGDDEYMFNMRVATERDDEAHHGDGAFYAAVDEAEADNAFCVDASVVGNIARFVNHSCAPNLFIQPVLGAEHSSPAQAAICFFAGECIPPLTELVYDYGPQYVRRKLQDGCRCAAAECVSGPAAGGPFQLPGAAAASASQE